MSYEPVLSGKPQHNAYTEHVYKLRVTFGAASIVAFRSKDATIAKLTTTTWKITLPKPYLEIIDWHVGRQLAASGVPGLEYIITTNNVAVDGTITVTSCLSGTGVATAPAAGDVIYIHLSVSCDMLNSKFIGTG